MRPAHEKRSCNEADCGACYVCILGRTDGRRYETLVRVAEGDLDRWIMLYNSQQCWSRVRGAWVLLYAERYATRDAAVTRSTALRVGSDIRIHVARTFRESFRPAAARRMRRKLARRLAPAMALFAWAWLMGWPQPAHADGEVWADLVVIDKSDRRLDLLSEGTVIRSYKVGLGGNPVGPKRRQGDQRTPEGDYIIDYRNPNSAFHLSLHISYPNQADRAESRRLGVPPGGDIFIHGLPNGWPTETAPKADWTLGCIAVDNPEIEEIWRLVPNGTRVRIDP